MTPAQERRAQGGDSRPAPDDGAPPEDPTTERAGRWIGFRLAVLAITLALAALALLGGGPAPAAGEHPVPGVDADALVRLAAALYPVLWYIQLTAACVLALVVTWNAAHRHEARILVIFLLALALPGADNPLRPLGLPGWAEVLIVFGAVWTGGAAFVRLAAVFPHRLEPRDLAAAPGAGRLRHALAAVDRVLLRPGVVWGAAAAFTGSLVLGMVLRTTAFDPAAPWLLLTGLTAWPLALVAGIQFLRRGYRLAAPGARRRALWMVAGLVGAAALLVLAMLVVPVLGTALLPLSEELYAFAVVVPVLLVPFAPLLVLVGVAVGLFYGGAISPELAIRGTTVYGVFGVLATFAFARLEELVERLLIGRVGLPGAAGPVLAGGTVAIAVGLLRDRARRLVHGGNAGRNERERRRA